MDYENERVLKLIFPNGAPEHLRENPEFLDYLYKLGSYKVDQIKKDQLRLSDDHKSIVEHTQDLAITNYKTFIQTSECSREIYSEFLATEKRLDGLIDNLPDFNKKCDDFVKTSSEINTSRHLNILALKKNAQLLEILELPQLMNSCIREGQYEEALELAAYVQRMAVKHGNIPIVKNILMSIEDSWFTMLSQLLDQLRTDLQLPKCLQVVGYLRRMQAFSASELKLKFLQARDSWFNNLLMGIPTQDPQHHIIKTIELTRINLFNIITQYKAIFAEEEISMGAIEKNTNDSSKIFYSWLHEKLEQFLRTLELDLNLGVNSLDTVLHQSMYFGLSFSRVGADFRGLMAPIFIKIVSQNFNNSIYKVTRQFEVDIDGFTLINKFSSGLTRSKSVTDRADENSPPETLLDFLPLATYCNGVLSTLNELRLCAPIAIANRVTNILQGSLENVSRSILAFYRQEQQAFSLNERDNFLKLCSCFAYDLIPYLQSALHIIFPTQTLASHLGINMLAIQKEELTYLRPKIILESLQHLLPDKNEAAIMSTSKSNEVTVGTATTSVSVS